MRCFGSKEFALVDIDTRMASKQASFELKRWPTTESVAESEPLLSSNGKSSNLRDLAGFWLCGLINNFGRLSPSRLLI